MSLKRKTQRLRKEYHLNYKKNLRIWGYSLAALSILLTKAAKHVYNHNPHSWYDITGRMDVLLLAFAITVSFVSFILKVNISRLELFLDIKKPTVFTLLSFIGPFFLIIISLFASTSLYVTPVVCSFIVFIFMTYRARKNA